MSTIAVLDAPAEPARKRPVTLIDQQQRLGFRMTLPAQLLLLFIVLFPMAMQVYLSMSFWGPTEGGDWTRAYQSFNWFENYATLIGDEEFWQSVRRTLLIMDRGSARVPVRARPRRALRRTVLRARRLLFHPVDPDDDGAGRGRLHVLHAVPKQRPGESDSFICERTVVAAGLAERAGDGGRGRHHCSVPQDQLTAAKILGANAWQRFVYISLPRMKGVIVIALALRAIEAFKLFDVPFIMTHGGPGTTTETVSHYIYKKTFNDLDWAYVAAIGLSLLILLSLIAVLALRVTARSQQRLRETGSRSWQPSNSNT
jgi:multiple sugar transport system permease protein